MQILKNSYQYLLIACSFLLIQCQKQTNWTESFSTKSKDPFGTYIIEQELPEIFHKNTVEILAVNITDYIYDNEENSTLKNYVIINRNTSKIGSDGIRSFLDFIEKGNDAFLSLQYFHSELREQLEFDISSPQSKLYSSNQLQDLDGYLSLSDSKKEYYYNRNIHGIYFDYWDSETTTILGHQSVDGVDEVNFIKIKHGEGNLFLHTQPIVFSNYYLLKEDNTYASKVLSHVSNKEVLWDPHTKKAEYGNDDTENSGPSIFQYFWSSPALTAFLLVISFGTLLFLLINARRKQRAKPEVEPLQNNAVAFAHAISNLYYIEGDHRNLIDKKIKFFLDKIRNQYLIDTQHLNQFFVEKLASKTGNDLETTRKLVDKIKEYNTKENCSSLDLIECNTMIDNYLKP